MIWPVSPQSLLYGPVPNGTLHVYGRVLWTYSGRRVRVSVKAQSKHRLSAHRPRNVIFVIRRVRGCPRTAHFLWAYNSTCAIELRAWKQNPLDSAHAPNASFHAHGQRRILWKTCTFNCAEDGVEHEKLSRPGPLGLLYIKTVEVCGMSSIIYLSKCVCMCL